MLSEDCPALQFITLNKPISTCACCCHRTNYKVLTSCVLKVQRMQCTTPMGGTPRAVGFASLRAASRASRCAREQKSPVFLKRLDDEYRSTRRLADCSHSCDHLGRLRPHTHSFGPPCTLSHAEQLIYCH